MPSNHFKNISLDKLQLSWCDVFDDFSTLCGQQVNISKMNIMLPLVPERRTALFFPATYYV